MAGPGVGRCVCYALRGTDVGYAATLSAKRCAVQTLLSAMRCPVLAVLAAMRCPEGERRRPVQLGDEELDAVSRISYAMSGTDIA
eukprot:232614-Rhodomonas_salina.2